MTFSIIFSLSEQNSPRWDAAFCGVPFGLCSLPMSHKKDEGGPLGRAVKSAVSKSLDHLTAVSGVGTSPALATCETSHLLLAGVSGCFSRGSPVFAPPTDWSVSCEL